MGELNHYPKPRAMERNLESQTECAVDMHTTPSHDNSQRWHDPVPHSVVHRTRCCKSWAAASCVQKLRCSLAWPSCTQRSRSTTSHLMPFSGENREASLHFVAGLLVYMAVTTVVCGGRAALTHQDHTGICFCFRFVLLLRTCPLLC